MPDTVRPSAEAARRIVVLDGHTLTATLPGHPAQAGEPDWQKIEALGDLTVFDRTAPAQILERAAGAPHVLINKVVLTADVLAELPDLRYVGLLSTGTNAIDLAAATQRGITVTNVPGYSTDSVAQHVFALLLELAHRTSEHDRAVQRGDWSRCPDFCFTTGPLVELAGKTLGIVGLGDIGRRVARIGAALGMRIAAAHQRSMGQVQLHGIDITWLPHDELFAAADVISLHCPLNEKTMKLVDAQRLATMKPGALLINTGRGGLIDEPALRAALESGHLGGAGLDVLSTEPPAADHPLLGAPRCVITPHVAWASQAARGRLMGIVAENLRGFLAGTPQNVVSG